MKQSKKLITMISTFALCLAFLFGNTITANADGASVTYYVKYVESTGEWKYQLNGWQDDSFQYDLSILSQNIKDGDHLAIDGSGKEANIVLNLNVNLSSLTYTASNVANITANHVDTFYAVNNAKGIVNATVTNAYVYDAALAQFNNDVDYLEIISSKGDTLKATIGSNGTVKHLKASSPNHVHFEFYDFATGALQISEGTLKSAAGTYNAAPTPTTPTPAPVAPSAPSASSGEYDDVPKTADIQFNPIWFIALAAMCFAGSYALKKEK